ncbi:forkhead protein sep1 [Podospora conica]|nr:forkhead protein sep1 [Schizothecium conicum]
MVKQARFGAGEPPTVFDEEFRYDLTTAAPMISHALMPQASKPPRRPLQSADANVVLNPPNSSFLNQSPFKPNTAMPNFDLSEWKPVQAKNLDMVPMMPPSRPSDSAATDSLEKKQPLMSRFKTVAQKPPPQQHQQNLAQLPPYPTYADFSILMDKENPHPMLYPAPAPQQFTSSPIYPQKPNGKRILMEAPPIKELRPAEKIKMEDPLPAPDSFAPIVDDGTKPNHSYATLIGMAIMRSAQRRLTLAQIYKWISDTFRFYNPTDAGWQNSIRHNLSLNKNFIKQDRPKNDPGKGHYWAIRPGTEHTFMKEKPSRKTVSTGENLPVMSTRLEPSQPPMLLMQEPMLPANNHIDMSSLPPLPPAMHVPNLAPAPEISSDATIPASDLGTIDEMPEPLSHDLMTDMMQNPAAYSPLPAAMQSSPPIPRQLESHHDRSSPPPQPALQRSSASKPRGRKRAFTAMDDSGYISSLESSALRPNQRASLLTSEDRPRIKRGRAEAEIARLRASSYDSPSKGRSYGCPPVSSSPLRQASQAPGQMLPPLTPATKLKAPLKPPPSLSPNTNLRLHRENISSMIDYTPSKYGAALAPEHDPALQLTPSFHHDEVFFGLDNKDDGAGVNIFEDNFDDNPFMLNHTPAWPTSVAHTGSPVKRSTKKQRLDRSLSTSALGDVSNSYNALPKSFLKVPEQSNAYLFDTPSKAFEGLASSPSKMFLQSPSKTTMVNENDENIAPWNFLDMPEDFLGDEQDIDISAGFERIGSTTAQSARPAPRALPKAPGLSRSYSTNF